MIDIAGNGLEAVEKVVEKNIPYDLVLMDLQMPVMDGLEATKKIREYINSDKLPIVAMSADAMSGPADEFLDTGMNDYLEKPLDTRGLYSKLMKWIRPRSFIDSDRNYNQTLMQRKVDLPRLPGLDTQKGINRVAGKTSLYKSLLSSFMGNNIDLVHGIRELISIGDIEKAEQLAHSFKGVAGNLGADDLYKSASVLIDALREKDFGCLEQNLLHLQSQMDVVFDGIEKYLDETDSQKKEGSEAALDIKLLSTLLVKLLRNMESDMGESLNVMEELMDYFKATEYAVQFSIVSGYMDNFDTDNARTAVIELMKMLGISINDEKK